jgi:hypothetical protein
MMGIIYQEPIKNQLISLAWVSKVRYAGGDEQMAKMTHTENTVYQSIRTVLTAARQKVYSAINSAMVEAYWDIGRQIMEAQKGQRAEYGTGLIKYLAERLTEEFGKGFDESSLRRMRQFFQVFQSVPQCGTN